MTSLKGGNEVRHKVLRLPRDGLKDRGVHKGCLNGLKIETGTEDAQRRDLFVFIVKDGTVECRFKGFKRRFGDVVCEVLYSFPLRHRQTSAATKMAPKGESAKEPWQELESARKKAQQRQHGVGLSTLGP